VTAAAPPALGSRPGDVDVVCLGESMVTFRPSAPGRPAARPMRVSAARTARAATCRVHWESSTS